MGTLFAALPYAQNAIGPYLLMNCDETTSAGELTEFAFNSNLLNSNSVWTQLMRIDSHSMPIIFVMWTGLIAYRMARKFDGDKI